jgi:hypothetical protein
MGDTVEDNMQRLSLLLISLSLFAIYHAKITIPRGMAKEK